MKKTPRLRGLLAGLGALTLGLVTITGAATAANAAPIIDDFTKTGNLFFHKFTQPDLLGTHADGREKAPEALAGLTPISGVSFTAYPVTGVDLTSNAGWLAASKLTVEGVESSSSIDRANPYHSSAPTNDDGDATIANLPLGLYYVTESNSTPGLVPAAPFLVFVPLTDQVDHNTWMYDIHIYPKSSETDTTKTVQDADVVKVGDTMSWTIRVDVPKVSAGLKYFKIDDKFDSKVTPIWSGARAPQLSLTADVAAGVPALPLTAGTDYSVLGEPGKVMSFEFTAIGLAKLDARWQGNIGATPSVPAAPNSKIQAIVSAVVDQTGTIYNNADIFVNDPNSTPLQPTPPESRLGDIEILKLAAGTEGTENPTTLAGAEFKVYTSEADATADKNAISISTNPNSDKSVWITGANGIASITGLRASNWANGAEVVPGDPEYRTYWVKEIKAPNGFQLLAKPIPVVVLSTIGDATFVRTEVLNSPGIDLPLTGSTGTAIFTVAGSALLLGGAALLIRRKRATA